MGKHRNAVRPVHRYYSSNLGIAEAVDDPRALTCPTRTETANPNDDGIQCHQAIGGQRISQVLRLIMDLHFAKCILDRQESSEYSQAMLMRVCHLIIDELYCHKHDDPVKDKQQFNTMRGILFQRAVSCGTYVLNDNCLEPHNLDEALNMLPANLDIGVDVLSSEGKKRIRDASDSQDSRASPARKKTRRSPGKTRPSPSHVDRLPAYFQGSHNAGLTTAPSHGPTLPSYFSDENNNILSTSDGSSSHQISFEPDPFHGMTQHQDGYSHTESHRHESDETLPAEMDTDLYTSLLSWPSSLDSNIFDGSDTSNTCAADPQLEATPAVVASSSSSLTVDEGAGTNVVSSLTPQAENFWDMNNTLTLDHNSSLDDAGNEWLSSVLLDYDGQSGLLDALADS